MTLAKVKTVSNATHYVNIETISSFRYDEKTDVSCITLNNDASLYVNGDITFKFAKAIVSSTNGNIIHLEQL